MGSPSCILELSPPKFRGDAPMNMISQHWYQTQENLFPHLSEKLGPMGDNHERLVTIIEFSNVRRIVKRFYPHGERSGGRPMEERSSIAIAFLAKHVFGLSTTVSLIDRLHFDQTLRRLCGWELRKSVPSEATFSRVFGEFSECGLTNILLDEMTKKYHSNRIIGHISRDSTEIDAREKSKISRREAKKAKEAKEKKRRGRPKKGEERQQAVIKETRLEKQQHQTLDEILSDLPNGCDYGCKKNSQGFKMMWKGYKYHIDSIDGDIPVSAILTSASLHDSQVAIPLSRLTSQKVNACYELMDAAYDASIIRDEIEKNGRVPLIDFNNRSPKDERKFEDFQAERYKNRSGAERVNSNLKDNLGARNIRVKGHKKVATHLGFGLIIMAIEQTIRLLT